MKLLSLMKKTPRLGLDVGSRTIKGVQLKKSGSKVCLDKFIFHDALEKTNDLENLKALIEVNGLKGSGVASVLDDKSLEIHDMTLPEMPHSELSSAIASQLEQMLSYPLEEAAYDFTKISTVNGQEGTSNRIRVYCVARNEIQEKMKFLKEADLLPLSLEGTGHALGAMLEFNGYLKAAQSAVIIDLGEKKITASCLNGSRVLYTNSLPVGLGLINRALTEKFEMTYEQGEQAKIEYASEHEATMSPIVNVIDEMYMQIFERLRRVLEFFKAETKDSPIQKIFLTGGGSKQQHVDAAFTSFFKIETNIVNPLKEIEIFSGKSTDEEIGLISPYLSTAVGLALRGINVG